MSYLNSIDVTQEAYILAGANSLTVYGLKLPPKIVVNYNPLCPSGIYMNPEFLDLINSQVKDINAIRLSDALKALASFYLQLSICATLKIINR